MLKLDESTSPSKLLVWLVQLLPLLLPRLLWRRFRKLFHSTKSSPFWHRTQLPFVELSPDTWLKWISLYKSKGRHLNGMMGWCIDIECRRLNILVGLFVTHALDILERFLQNRVQTTRCLVHFFKSHVKLCHDFSLVRWNLRWTDHK